MRTLEAIENPSLMMKLVYFFSKKKFGKVLTPLKVVSARLPFSFSMFSNKINSLDKKLKLPRELALLVRHQTAQINTCSFCMDIGMAFAIKENCSEDKFHHLDEYRIYPIYSSKERAALMFAEELTANKKVSDETFLLAKKHFSEREIVEIAWLVATEHYYNIMNLAFDLHSDNLCQIRTHKG